MSLTKRASFEFCSISFPILLIGLLIASCDAVEEISEVLNANVGHSVTGVGRVEFQTRWKGSSRFIGPEWWPNPLQDWYLEDGVVSGYANRERTLCLLPYEIHKKGTKLVFNIQVKLEHFKLRRKLVDLFGAGFQIGCRSGLDDFRHTLINTNDSINAVLRLDGRLQLGDKYSDGALEMWNKDFSNLTMTIERLNDVANIELKAERDGYTVLVQDSFEMKKLTGGISILSQGRNRPDLVYSKFKNLDMRGDMLAYFEDRIFGPLLWSQYLLNGENLRIQVILSMIQEKVPVELWVSTNHGQEIMEKVMVRQPDDLTNTVLFNLQGWDGTKQKRYEIRMNWRDREFKWSGIIRREPLDADKLKVAAFSCDNGFAFPLEPMVNQVKRQDPDLVAFLGDQIYENFGGFGVNRTQDVKYGLMDFFRKYYQFGWTWRDVLADRPSVIIPDDHDIFQINLWGNGGVAMTDTLEYELGGYVMPGEWVKAVEHIQTGHLPDPARDMTLPIGIKPYFTNFTYAGVGFAVLEDRKFKSAPKAVDDWKSGEGEILGKEQEAFLQEWSKDWCDHDIKVAFTQTIFARPVTHMGGDSITRTHYIIDSGSWPQKPRNRAVKLFGDGNILTIHGDQHHGILLQQGVENYNDAGYAFMVPGTANSFNRAWWPGLEDSEFPGPPESYLGRNIDECGNPLDVIAVGNPDFTRIEVPEGANAYERAKMKGSGYGMVEFDKSSKTALVNLYRLGENDEQFPTFPARIPLNVSKIEHHKDVCLHR